MRIVQPKFEDLRFRLEEEFCKRMCANTSNGQLPIQFKYLSYDREFVLHQGQFYILYNILYVFVKVESGT